MAFRLSIEQGKLRGKVFDFTVEAITIGRAEENDVALYEEQGVSRRHARIAQEDGEYVIEDLDSANGTVLNGAKVKKEPLGDGDTIGIGTVVFRFGVGQVAKTEESGTRVVSLTKDSPRTNPRAEIPTKPASTGAAASPTAGAPAAPSPKVVRGVLGGLIVAMLAAGAFVAYQDRPHATRSNKPDCDPVMQYEDIPLPRLYTFGNNAETACIAPNRFAFGFHAKPGQKVILSYAPFYTNTGQVAIVLNDKKLQDVELSPTRQSKRYEVTLPQSMLYTDKNNVVAFVTDRDDQWGIDRPELQFFSKEESDATKGEEAYRRGQLAYERRHVSAGNLYDAWKELRNARRLMEAVEPQPPDCKAAKELIAKAEDELDSLCREQIFSARREMKYDHFQEANERLQYILKAFPGDEHPCKMQSGDVSHELAVRQAVEQQ